MRHIVRYQSPRHDRALQADMRQVFERFFPSSDARDDAPVSEAAQWQARVDIREEPARFVILADLPGVDPQDVEVLMDKGVLSIRGERRADAAVDGQRDARLERRQGAFHRRFALPDTADADGIVASGRNGVLTIAIPKRAEVQPRRIVVGDGEATRQ